MVTKTSNEHSSTMMAACVPKEFMHNNSARNGQSVPASIVAQKANVNAEKQEIAMIVNARDPLRPQQEYRSQVNVMIGKATQSAEDVPEERATDRVRNSITFKAATKEAGAFLDPKSGGGTPVISNCSKVCHQWSKPNLANGFTVTRKDLRHMIIK